MAAIWTPALAGDDLGLDPSYLSGDQDLVLGMIAGDGEQSLMQALSGEMDAGQIVQALAGDPELGAMVRRHIASKGMQPRRSSLPVNPTLAREVLRGRERALQDAKRIADKYTIMGLLQDFTAGQTATLTVSPSETYTPEKFWVDPAIASNFQFNSGFIGSQNVFGNSTAVMATSFALDYPVEVRWQGFSPTKPLIFSITNNDAVNTRRFRGSLYGTSHQTVG